MAERFITLPIGYVLGADEFATADEAVADATRRAGTSNAPRAVLRVVAEVQPSAVRPVAVNRFDTEAAHVDP